MKVFLALTVILGGVLISKNSYADFTTVTSSNKVAFVPTALQQAHTENATNSAGCKYLKSSASVDKSGEPDGGSAFQKVKTHL